MTENHTPTAPDDVPTVDEVQEQPFVMDAELRARLNSAASDLAEATQQKRQLIGKVETMQRARAAAQADASAARQKWRNKLRESDGTLTREVQKMRVAERTALSLLEEYEALEAELSGDLPRLELLAAEAAANRVGAKNAAISDAARHAYEQALVYAGEASGTCLRALSQSRKSKSFCAQ